jgi:hypothetical protein
MSDLMLLIRMEARVATFLAGRPLDRLIALAEGRMTLAVADSSAETATPPTAPAKSPPPASAAFDAAGTAARLRNCSTLDEGADLLATLNPKVPDLKALAKALDIPARRSGIRHGFREMFSTIRNVVARKHRAEIPSR